MSKTTMCLFNLNASVRVFRLACTDRPLSKRIIEFATLVIELDFENLPSVLKDRFGLFSPNYYPVSSEGEVLEWIQKIKNA